MQIQEMLLLIYLRDWKQKKTSCCINLNKKKNTLSQSSHLKSPRVQLANFVWMLKWF